MRLTLISYVTVEREEGRSVYVCQPLRGPQFTTRDPLLGSALSKLGNKMRKTINEWVKDGKANRVSSWLYDPEMRTQVEKLTLVLRDRTLRWKLLLVTWPAFDRHIAFSPSIPDVVFEIASLADLDTRATEIYSEWAQSQLPHAEEVLAVVGTGSDLWTEPIEVDIDTQVRNRKKPKNILAALFGDVPLSGTEELHKVGQCLDDLAGDFETALGRSELVDEVDRMLLRNDRQGVLLVGPTSSGKTAIIHECAKRRVVRFRNRRGHKPQVWWLSPQRLISGMSYLGQWEQRWLAILREATKRDHVLYFDDLVGLFSAGRTRDSSLSAADVLRSYRAENRVRILVESTEEQLAILRRRDRALADQFHLIRVPAVSSDEALPIVLQSTANVEVQTDRFFHPETIPLIMRHQEIFAPDRAFPGKAIEMTKTLVKHSSEVVDRGVFYRLAGNQVGANLMLLVGRLGDQQAISQSLSEQLIGQPEAVSALSRIVVRFAQHLQPTDRPLGVLLLLGPTGVGKTESAKALTRLLYSDESHLVRLDMNEMTTPHAAEQLVGTFEQPEGRLTSAVRRQPNCVILLDEIEKAHPDVFDYLLQVIGEGRLTDARGRVADFRSSIILLTSNLGVAEQSASLGFETTAARRAQIYTKAAQSFFRPEFFNRIDDVLAFRSLDTSDMRKIVRIQMNDVLSRDGIQRRNVYINVAESAVERVIKTGFDSQLGARAVRRMLESEIIGPLGDCLSNLAIDHPALVYITDSVAKSGVDCQVTPLEVVRRSARKRRSNLEQVIEIGESIYERLDERLSELAASLQEVDVQLDARTHKASYYSLREYMHRCSDCLKAGKAALSQRSEPRLQLNASPSARPKRDWDGTGARRQLLDWQAQEDLRSEIKGDQGLASGEASEEILVRQIIDALTTASAFIEHALAPRNWLIGFTELTDSSSDAASEQEFKRQVGRDYEIYGHTTGAQDFLVRLVNCLRHGWQYEVDSDEAPHGFWHVAGVALSGILKPLLGTYRTEFPGKPSHLSVLRAIPVLDEVFGSCGTEPLLELAASADEKYEHWLGVISTNRLRGSEGDLITPAEQIIPTEKVRGVVGEQVVDFISGAALELSGDDWFSRRKDAGSIDAVVDRLLAGAARVAGGMNMFARLPVLIDQPEPGVAVAQLLDGPEQQAVGVSVEQALRLLKRQMTREIKKHRVSAWSTWKAATLFQRSFPVQPTVFHRRRRFPTGPKVSLPVRYVELIDQRDQLYLLLPDFGDVEFVSERKLLKTVLADNVRSKTTDLSPQEIHSLWPAESSEIRWMRLKLADPIRFRSAVPTKVLRTVAEPLTDRRNLTVVPGSRDRCLETLRETLAGDSCLVVGESGVGKSTMITTMARDMDSARRKELKKSRSKPEFGSERVPIFWQSSGGRLIAGMRYLGQWQQRLEAVVAELSDIDGILFIENLLDLVSVGGCEPRDSLAAFLLPYLRSGSLRMVAEATPTELDACQRMLPALIDAMPPVEVLPMTPNHEIELLRVTLANRLQSTHIEFDPDIPSCLSRLCRQFQRHSSPPGPAMRFIEDLTGRRRSQDVPDKWTIPWILENFSKRTGLPLPLIDDTTTLDRDDICEVLAREVIGQQRACSEMASMVTRIKSAVQDPKRPFGCLLFCGPTGVGKTQLAKSLAAYLFGASGEKTPLTRLDMSEYSGPAAGFRFLNNAEGNPAAWIQQIRSRPLSVVLLDEIEKASPEVFDILLSVLDEGRLTDRLGRVTSFRNSVILMTSNLGATSSTSLGFGDDKSVNYESEVRKAFKPEFFNRLDRIIAFSPLSSEVIRRIIEKELGELQVREGLERYGRSIRWTEALVDRLAQLGVGSQLGARPLQQTIESEVVAPLSRWLVENSDVDSIQLTIDWIRELNTLKIADDSPR